VAEAVPIARVSKETIAAATVLEGVGGATVAAATAIAAGDARPAAAVAAVPAAGVGEAAAVVDTALAAGDCEFYATADSALKARIGEATAAASAAHVVSAGEGDAAVVSARMPGLTASAASLCVWASASAVHRAWVGFEAASSSAPNGVDAPALFMSDATEDYDGSIIETSPVVLGDVFEPSTEQSDAGGDFPSFVHVSRTLDDAEEVCYIFRRGDHQTFWLHALEIFELKTVGSMWLPYVGVTSECIGCKRG
jgi:hypothetical protein